MSSTAAPRSLPSTAQRASLLYRELIGKKAAMALSGVVLFGYVIGHMAGNLQIFMGRQKINDYAKFLHSTPSLLWGTRTLLLIAVAVHIYTGLSLAARAKAARPVAYRVKGARQPNIAARTMVLSGLVIGAFVVYHLLHLTVGSVHPNFVDLDPYDNLVTGFRVTPVAIAYIISVALLGVHLYHGAWSMFQSLGLSHPRYTPALKTFAAAISVVLVAGFCAVPISIMTGVIH